MSATIDGARVASLLGDAPVIAAEGRAFPVETRYLGRDARPIEPQIADAIVRAMRADTGSLLAFLPGAGEIRRTQALLDGRFDPSVDVVALYGALAADEQDRAIAPLRARPAQDRAGHLDRRDVDHHRGRAHRDRLRACPRAALRARCRGDAARNRAGVARRRRPAPRPRRPHRARHLLPAVGRAADRGARTVFPAGNPVRRFVVAGARPRGLGQRPGEPCLPRSAAAPGARRGESLARRTRRHRRRRPHHRGRPKTAAPAAAAAARPHGGRCGGRRRRAAGCRDRRPHRRTRPCRRRC